MVEEGGQADGLGAAVKPPTLAFCGFTLRPLEASRDHEALHAIFGNSECMRYMSRAATASPVATHALLSEWSADKDSPQWVIARNEVDCSVPSPALGRVTLMPRREGVMEVGIQVSPAEQGKGLARQAVAAVTRYALGCLSVKRVYGDVDPENAGCVRMFERAGFRLEGRLVANWVTHTGVEDSLIFAATCKDDTWCDNPL